MILQPLVENSIKHGLSNKVEGGSIRIAAHRNGAKLNVVVEDDGAGIPDSKLNTLLDRGIGVTNVNERLKVLFGSEYRMWVESQPGRGTRIRIEMPELETGLAAVS
jgi:two-component system LytT family sensor kinase